MRSETALIGEVLAGNPEAFAELVRVHQARVRLACLVFLTNKEEADDAAQEAFVKAFQSLDRFRGDASFETWILRIAENHCRDLLRSRKSHRIESLDALLAEKGDAVEGFFAKQGISKDYSSEDLELLGKLFAALPEDDREILALCEVEKLAYQEIAVRLHCSLDAVKGRLKRARQKLIEKCSKFISDTSVLHPRL
jgi:RNA polymerase sigma-70 factor (ECF subfamily)